MIAVFSWRPDTALHNASAILAAHVGKQPRLCTWLVISKDGQPCESCYMLTCQATGLELLSRLSPQKLGYCQGN